MNVVFGGNLISKHRLQLCDNLSSDSTETNYKKIAMGAIGSDLAIQSADIALMGDNLSNIPASIELARMTRKVIYQNLGLSLGISFLMLLLSAFGIISVLAGAFLHNIGAFAVILNSSRILKLNRE